MSFRNSWKSELLASFSSLFRRECKLILYWTTMYLYCVYPAISKSPKHLPNCLKITEARVALIVFNGVICDVSTYTVTISFCRSSWSRYQKSGPWPNNTKVYLTPFISTQNHTMAGFCFCLIMAIINLDKYNFFTVWVFVKYQHLSCLKTMTINMYFFIKGIIDILI